MSAPFDLAGARKLPHPAAVPDPDAKAHALLAAVPVEALAALYDVVNAAANAVVTAETWPLIADRTAFTLSKAAEFLDAEGDYLARRAQLIAEELESRPRPTGEFELGEWARVIIDHSARCNETAAFIGDAAERLRDQNRKDREGAR